MICPVCLRVRSGVEYHRIFIKDQNSFYRCFKCQACGVKFKTVEKVLGIKRSDDKDFRVIDPVLDYIAKNHIPKSGGGR